MARPLSRHLSKTVGEFVRRDLEPRALPVRFGPAHTKAFSPGAEGQLEWDFNFIPREGLTLTWQVTPLELGVQQVSAGGEGQFRDLANRTGEFSAAPVSVVVVAPSATPEPSATPLPEPDALFVPVVARP